MYAKLVRNIVIRNASPPKLKIEKSTYHQIQASRKFLFPNLMEIYCDGRLEDVCLLLSPSLRRVVLLEDKIFKFDTPPPAMFTFISALPKICPDLQSLEVYLRDLPSSAMRSIQKLQNLQYLGLKFVPSQESNIKHYTSISLLPNLRLLQFSGSRGRWSAPDYPKFHSPEAFCALQQLDFYASLESIVNWLPSFISPNMTTFTAEIDATWIDDEEENRFSAKELCYELCDTLAKHARSPSSTLRTLLFISNSSAVSSTEVEAFQPLLALRGLETLVFDIPLNGFDDSTLIKWARTWSNLKTFRVEPSSEVYGEDSTITLFGVRELFQLCPDLKSLTLSFDASELHLVPEIPTTPSLRHGLKDWDIDVSEVTSATLDPVLAVLNWVFLDMWDVRARRFNLAYSIASEALPHSLGRVAAKERP